MATTTPHHTNPPQLNFTKAVGNKQVKEEITGLVNQVLHVLAPNVDFSSFTLDMVLTRASRSTQSADGMVGAKLENLGAGNYETNLDTIYMNLKIPKTDGTRDNSAFDCLEMVIAHEMVHYVQMMMKALWTRASQPSAYSRPRYFRNWNETQASVITRNVLNAVSGLSFGTLDFMPVEEAYNGAVQKPLNRRPSHEQYLALPHETQAFRLTPLIMKACGWNVSFKDARRKASDARKASIGRNYGNLSRKPEKVAYEDIRSVKEMRKRQNDSRKRAGLPPLAGR